MRTSNDSRRIQDENHALPDSATMQGSLLLEAIIAIGIFAIFLGGIGFSLILGERNVLASGDRTRGAFLAEQQLEGLREMRNRNFSLLTAGMHGMTLTGTGWNFAGTSTTKNGYTASVLLTTHQTDWVDAESRVGWNFKNTRSGSVTVHTSITNWRKTLTIGNWAAMSNIAKVTVSGSPDFQKITVSGNYAFITSTQASGGAGLYVFDITNPASPVRVNSSFNLGASAYGVAVRNNRLYLATDNPTQEIQVYDITNPTSLVAGNLVNSIDLPGSGKTRSIAVYGDTAYVGLLDDPPNPQFYSILMSETGPMTIQDSLTMSGSVLNISLHEGYAYIANSYNAGELDVVDIFDPTAIVFASGVGIDLTDTQDGSAIATFGTSALIGRLNGSTIDELSLYPIADSPVPVTPPGPWTLEVGGDVNAIETIAGSKYAFIGTNVSSQQIEVLDTVKFAAGLAPVVKTYNANATMRGLFYDWQDDRLYGISASDLYVFSPG